MSKVMTVLGASGESARRPSLSLHLRLRGGIPRVLAATLCASIALVSTACQDRANRMEVPKLPGSASSLDDLGQKVVSGFVSRDDSALAALRLTMLEYTESIWPELPASEASLNVPLEYVWNDIEARNRRALNRMGVWLAGRSIEALGVECRGEVLELSTFRIHTDCWVAVRSPRRVLADVQLFKDVVERSGGYKVFRYYER